MHALPLLLAARTASASGSATSLGRMIVPLAIIIVLAALLLSVLWLVRRRFRQHDVPGAATGFSIAELRDLHRAGKLSTEEFERAKALLVASVHSSIRRDAKTTSTVETLGSEPK